MLPICDFVSSGELCGFCVCAVIIFKFSGFSGWARVARGALFACISLAWVLRKSFKEISSALDVSLIDGASILTGGNVRIFMATVSASGPDNVVEITC